MERKVETKELADQPVVSMRFKTSIAKIGEDFGRAFGALFGYLGRTGVQPAGPPFALFHDEEFKEEDMDAELCVPVAEEVPGEGDVTGRVVPGGKVASTVHVGAYDEVGPAWEDLMLWISENGYRPSGPGREIYLVGPESAQNPADYRTEVVFPIADL